MGPECALRKAVPGFGGVAKGPLSPIPLPPGLVRYWHACLLEHGLILLGMLGVEETLMRVFC